MVNLVCVSFQSVQLPPGQGMVAEGGWISPNSHSQNNSPRYSPDPGEMVATGGGVAGGGVSYPVNSMGVVSTAGRREGGGGRRREEREGGEKEEGGEEGGEEGRGGRGGGNRRWGGGGVKKSGKWEENITSYYWCYDRFGTSTALPPPISS